MNVFIQNQYGDNSTTIVFLGQADVGSHWRDNIYTYVASWDPGTSMKVKGRESENDRFDSSSSAED